MAQVSSTEIAVQEVVITVPGVEQVATGLARPMVKLSLLSNGALHDYWCWLDPNTAKGIGEEMIKSGDACLEQHGDKGKLIIATPQMAEHAAKQTDGIGKLRTPDQG